MADLETQARAMGDPTRHRLFRYVVEADRPVDVAELTAHVGLNHNAVRQHLAKLVAADLVLEAAAPPAGRGRPRLLYTRHPAADSRWGGAGPYERLAVLLTEVVGSDQTPIEVGRRAGLRQGSAQGSPSNDPTATFAEAMATQGFDPVVTRDGDAVAFTLQACPFASAVLADPDTVCQLHLGLAQGAAEAIGGLDIHELVPQDPRAAHCRLLGRLTSDPTPP